MISRHSILAVLAFGIGDVQRLIGLHDAAAPNAEDQSALGDVVQGVAASSAMRSGLANGSTCTLVPILMLSVRAAIAVPRTSGLAARARRLSKCSSASH